MIYKIIFKNYKIFKKVQTLELKPITILIGKNNTGKSAVMKLPLMIEGALDTEASKPVDIKHEGVVIGNENRDLIYGKFSRALELKLFQVNKSLGDDDILSAHILIDSRNDTPILDYWKLNDNLELQRVDNSTYLNEIDDVEYDCSFKGLYLANYFYNDNPDVSGTIYEQAFNLNTDFISGIRENPKKYYDFNATSDKKSGKNGSNLYNFLIEDFLSTDKKFFYKIQEWIKNKFEGWELYVDVDSEPYRIELRKGTLEINLSETGMGIGQSLPLIIRAIKPCTEKTLIIVEEPESNLHPYAHAELAQLFVESLRDENKKYLFETHSLNFVLRMRRLVAENKLDKDDLALYYVDFDEEKNESNLKRINVDRGGGVDWWPEGVFSETTKETRAIYNAQLNNSGNVDKD